MPSNEADWPHPVQGETHQNRTLHFCLFFSCLYFTHLHQNSFCPALPKKTFAQDPPAYIVGQKANYVIKTPEKVLNHRPTPRISRNPEGGGQQVQSSALKMTEKLTGGENRNTINKTDRNKHSDIDFLSKQGFYGKL
ncbi:hypothetical protein AVEN_51800-1 [Araneus ventricosus]|uniref:Uncharacterized protein n=1 Tax=Araneus ventricosus TaxID=182803 RepID=A0A4Y2IBC4_ARAVE|nr:hypothetical protein AVEN_51800-1 [Araneus ventricosus]